MKPLPDLSYLRDIGVAPKKGRGKGFHDVCTCCTTLDQIREISMKVKYIGATDDQVRWGSNEDPRPLLKQGEIYTLFREEVHTQHTKYYLLEHPTLPFNSVSFERVV
jgi:hypothetical protein